MPDVHPIGIHHFADLATVKLLRLCLLVALAVLVPVRGAMGVAMPCMPAGGEMPAELQAHEGGHPPCHDEASAEPQPQQGGQACERCTDFCSLTPLLGSVPALVAPGMLCTTIYPVLNAPAPSFESGGPERPPRST